MSAVEEMREALANALTRSEGAPVAVERLERLSGGASQELWSLVAVSAAGPRPLVLRRNPGGVTRRETAAGMETEARLIRLAGAAGAPVPAVAHVLTPADGLGSGYLMERVEGETLARRLLRDAEYAAARAGLARQIGEAAARIHAIPVDAAGELRRTTPQTSLDQTYQLYLTNGTPRPVVEWAFRWLRARVPPPPETPCVVHGDLRNGNIMVGPDGLRAVLDWEIVHIGDPMEDLAWVCVTSWRFGEIDRPAGGFGAREDMFAGYADASGRAPDPDRVRFWETLGVLRWGMSCAMMAREFLEGDRSVERAAIGRRASETAVDLLSMLAPRWGLRHA